MALLLLLQGGETIPFTLSESETVIGRHSDCQVMLNSNMVSRRHARVVVREGAYCIEDLGSGNGTYLNGQPVLEPTPLKHDDRVKVGPILFRFDSGNTNGENTPTGEYSESDLISPESLDIKPTALGVRLSDTDVDSEQIMSSMSSTDTFSMLTVKPEVKLKAIVDITRALAGTTRIEALLPKILDTLFVIFPQADRGCILLRDPDSGQIIPHATKHRRDDEDETVKISRTILRKVLEEKRGILSADASNDSRFDASASISNLSIRSMMCVPMLNPYEEPMGAIHIDTQSAFHQFKQNDLDLLMAVASQAAASYYSAELLVSHMERQRLENEMNMARNVQAAILPKTFPTVGGYEFFANYEPALAVGGDYYDCIPLSADRMCLTFGDVAGKGVAASLVMSRISSFVRSTMEFVPHVEKAAMRINEHMCSSSVEGRFVTFVLSMMDCRKHKLSCVIAGHMSPMIRRRDGSIDTFDDEDIGVPIGVIDDFPYTSVHTTLQPGETVVIFTDGVSEALNHNNELYGIERLRKLVANSSLSASQLGQAIREDVRLHAGSRPQNDDITLMVFGRT
ncbi:MAG: SpoIIE family protein phosphatase [Planctomycetota bacterium]|nr:SpoIIE family protein phosphatase [Planctomycetota bacterium]MDA1211892.1 SpoIIE family protein phosphatase [Planctomycetota bacterium]